MESRAQLSAPEPGERPGEWQQVVTLDDIAEEGQRLLKYYSGLKHEDILSHVLAIREKGFAVAPFTCVGQIKFLINRFPTVPFYQTFLSRLHSGANFVDVGCGFGQELRYLILNEKISPAQLHGFDLLSEFIELGYDLFRDKERLQLSLFAADILAAPNTNPELEQLTGRMDLVQINQVLHVFDWDDMLRACECLVRLTTPQPGSMIAGTQMGSHNPGSYPMPARTAASTGKIYRHNPESMEKFWTIIGEATDSKWHVECKEIYSPAVEQNKHQWWAKLDPGGCMICFCVTRL